MKRYEKESLVKNFLVFFSLLTGLLILLFLELNHTQKREYKQSLYKTMQVCSYTLDCKQYNFDFANKDMTKLNKLYENNETLDSYFTIPNSKKFHLKITYPKIIYLQDVRNIQQELWFKFIFAEILLFILSLFFTFYSLSPIRKALSLNDEFIKDILHDFNTPITSMVLNIKMFEEEKGKNPFISRITTSIDNILLLQNNLKCFLQHSPSQNASVNLAKLSKNRLEFMQSIYPKTTFIYEKNNDLIRISNEEILTRIFDNILSNAAKYNRINGEVKITINRTKISISDTGKGIKNISKVMQRYYKEQDRGLGLGLHIVQKLVNELNIEMEVISKIDVGTTFILDFKHLGKESV